MKKALLYLKSVLKLIIPVYVLQEESFQSHSPMTVLYAGYSKVKRAYYGKLILGVRPYKTVFLGFIRFGNLKRFKSKECVPDIIVAETSTLTISYFLNQDGYVIPEWVAIKINISQPLKEIAGQSVSRLSKGESAARKHHWVSETTEDPQRFKEFFFKMYLPNVQKHGDRIIKISYSQYKEFCKSAFLVLLKEGDVPIAGSLNSYDKENVVWRFLGIIDGNVEYLKQGVVGALYYYLILECQRRGYREADLGDTSPFLNDGLTHYKLSWNGKFIFDYDKTRDHLWMSQRMDSDKANEFIRNNPFICLGKDWKLKIERHE